MPLKPRAFLFISSVLLLLYSWIKLYHTQLLVCVGNKYTLVYVTFNQSYSISFTTKLSRHSFYNHFKVPVFNLNLSVKTADYFMLNRNIIQRGQFREVSPRLISWINFVHHIRKDIIIHSFESISFIKIHSQTQSKSKFKKGLDSNTSSKESLNRFMGHIYNRDQILTFFTTFN